jgi:TRAP-type C4-dicarboxylate transport system permease large subunit
MLLVIGSAALGLHLTETQVPQRLAQWITGLTSDPIIVLMLLNVTLFLLGTILHGAAAIILIVPIVMPLVRSLGIDPVHFGILLTLNIAIGQQTPPVASVLATSCSIAKTDMWATTRVNLPFIMVLIGLVLVVTYVPAIPLSLVEFFYR